MAAANYPDYFSVGYTEEVDPEPTDFVWLAEQVGPPSQWTEYSYTIPATAKHIAIRNVSTYEGFVLMIDDIYIDSLPRMKANSRSERGVAAAPDVEYEVYLDGAKVATTTANSYLFENLSEGEHEAGVKTVYNSGESEMVTIKFGGESEIESVQAAGNLAIYPNPARTVVHVEGDYARLVVSSINGVRVLESSCESTLDVSNLDAGVYVVMAYDEDNRLVGHTKLAIVR